MQNASSTQRDAHDRLSTHPQLRADPPAMISRPAGRRASSRKLSPRPRLRPKKSRKAAGDSCAAAPPIRAPSPAGVAKPMRPLTAYHVFFQIEREYIIQTTAGPDADESIHAEKSYLGDVPRRYRRTALRSDWYAGPGKRKKRKHRKSHGKIGFLELSRVISARWATLGTTDPETKRFVTRIAARELEEYRAEVRRYKALAEGAAAPRPPSASPAPAPADARAAAADTDVAAPPSPSAAHAPADAGAAGVAVAAIISPRDSPALRPMEVSSSSVLPMTSDPRQPMGDSPALRRAEIPPSGAPPAMPDLPQSMEYTQAESVELVLSLDREFASSAGSVDDEIDYSICSLSNNGHYIPSSPVSSDRRGDTTHPDGTVCDPLYELDDGFSFQHNGHYIPSSPVSSDRRGDTTHPDGTICDPLFELDGGDGFQQPIEKRCVSPSISETTLDDVGIIGDHGVFQRTAALLKKHGW